MGNNQCLRRRSRSNQGQLDPFKSSAVVPQPSSDELQEVDELESLGNSDDDDWIDESSSGSDFGISPERQWMKQDRRMQRQKKRRQRTARRRFKQSVGDAGSVPVGLDDLYMLGARVGRGTFGTVSKCTEIATQANRALKTVHKDRSSGIEQLHEEVAILRSVAHPSIVKFFDAFEDEKCIHFIMEFICGGLLFDRLSEFRGKGLGERVSAKLSLQVAGAVAYLHSDYIRVAHRDLKPENIMVVEQGVDLAKAVVKVIDFSLSRRFQPGTFLRTLACTPAYVAPEVLHGMYTQACDIWSFGVFIYVLLSCELPFVGSCEAEILEHVKSGKYGFDSKPWDGTGATSKDLIRKMLVVDPKKRLTAEQVRHHAWFESTGV